jgi:hypothetical protein
MQSSAVAHQSAAFCDGVKIAERVNPILPISDSMGAWEL